ncbi:alkylation response protein AidB-like acyl-CoA dehydrogenase [Catalinimonas alkaloidigena]|uniref:acyl-CoA dehydrogenase family protein n=1 Tax=Catalinimonas alkaloidigena TaxID=1075417 RepID=UPI002405B99A|nr:acyl-CoA dehydrogenase family protein [Catalinimonas alkaloidigena]MDF9796603.1 alkylation response protein AidB-like acyl-CoA dehydrogenase [Catalinimonas alkaloidigena]
MDAVKEEQATITQWTELIHSLGKDFVSRAARYDASDTFVKENYVALKEHKFFTAMIPTALGGQGLSHAQMCSMLREIAHYDSSTALALSMHQHLLAANIWKYKHGKGGEVVLKKVVNQQLTLISTGARDWLESNGKMEKVEGGYLVSAEKHFASQASVGDVLVTSAPYKDPEKGWQVLHFPIPMHTKGVFVMDNWHTLGMRGTGSHTVKLDQVFVPESAIVLSRPQGEYHMFWNVVLTVALPLIMSVYVGIAEQAVETALKNVSVKPHMPVLIGEMNNELINAQVVLKDMIGLCNNFDFQPTDHMGQAMMCRKSLVAKSAIKAVEKAMEAVGGRSFFRAFTLERLFRDVQAGIFHPLPEKSQHQFSGEFLLQKKSPLAAWE